MGGENGERRIGGHLLFSVSTHERNDGFKRTCVAIINKYIKEE